MIGTEASNNERIGINASYIICDKNQEFKFKLFPKNAIFSYENRQTGVKCGLKHNKIKVFSKLNQRHYHLQKRLCSIHEY